MKPLDPEIDAIVQALEEIKPGISEEIKPGISKIVQALEEIKPGISKDARAVAGCLAWLEPPKSVPERPRPAEMARFVEALERDKISRASWFMIAMEAQNAGYYLPSNVDTMARIAGEAATKIGRTRRTCASHGRHVAGACAELYRNLTHTLPKILNYRQLGRCNDYARLAHASFDALGLPGWGWAAEDAARELKHEVEYKKEP
jgi:hypothetical protein